jgi:hypothetical protein
MRALGLLLLAVVACTPDFAAQSDVTDLRILAVQADPPEAQYDSGSSPPTVDPVVITVLAADPRSSSSMTMTFQLCAPTDSRRCDDGPATDPVVRALSPTKLHVSPAALLQALAADDLKGFGGVRVQFSFSVDDGDARGPAYGSKVLLFSPRGGTPNRNPVIEDLQLTQAGVSFGPGTVAPEATLELPLGAEIGLRPRITEGSRERYATVDYRGNPVTLLEQPRYSFFVTPGAEIGVDNADEPLEGIAAPPDGLSWIAARKEGATGTLWIVVRDGRGGESWARFSWKAVAATPNAWQPPGGHARPVHR